MIMVWVCNRPGQNNNLSGVGQKLGKIVKAKVGKTQNSNKGKVNKGRTNLMNQKKKRESGRKVKKGVRGRQNSYRRGSRRHEKGGFLVGGKGKKKNGRKVGFPPAPEEGDNRKTPDRGRNEKNKGNVTRRGGEIRKKVGNWGGGNVSTRTGGRKEELWLGWKK